MPVNLGNPGEFTINELAEMIRSMVPTRSAIIYKPLPKDDPQRRRPDISRATELFDWQPTVPLVEGLGNTIDWFANNLSDRPERRAATPRRHRSTVASQPVSAQS
jgi:UDP-glucuronate decarboxylase